MFGKLKQTQFGGAYYRKVTSEPSIEYSGIRGEGFLPILHFDKSPSRYFIHKESWDHFKTGPMDRPSVYFGGHAGGRELDAGISWDRVWKAKDVATYTDQPEWCHRGKPKQLFTLAPGGKVIDGTDEVVAEGLSEDEFREKFRPNFAFRPFWRTTNTGDKSGGWHNPKPGAPDNIYFYPGERIVMNLRAVALESIRLDIRAVDEPEREFHVTFQQTGFGPGKTQSFKRVNALDQFIVAADGNRKGNEMNRVVPTKTRALAGSWLKVELLGNDFNPIQPLVGESALQIVGHDLFQFFADVFQLSEQNDEGGEVLDIDPTAMNPQGTVSA